MFEKLGLKKNFASTANKSAAYFEEQEYENLRAKFAAKWSAEVKGGSVIKLNISQVVRVISSTN